MKFTLTGDFLASSGLEQTIIETAHPTKTALSDLYFGTDIQDFGIVIVCHHGTFRPRTRFRPVQRSFIMDSIVPYELIAPMTHEQRRKFVLQRLCDDIQTTLARRNPPFRDFDYLALVAALAEHFRSHGWL